jgi:DNA polymerase III sliding clamp (beta) subunit (PCNA family)
VLSELKFVQGAVAKKEFIPAMKHFAIENGFVRAYNGKLALCAPIAFNIDCKPEAAPLVNAITQCEDAIQLTMTDKGRLRIVSGNFKAFINCIQEDTPHVHPEGEEVKFDGDAMLRALKVVEPFISDDASRPWANGVLMRGQSVLATNNVTAVEYWTGAQMPITVNIPRAAVEELLRINEAPTHAQVTENSMTFHYPDKRWVRTQLLTTEWPEFKFFEQENKPTPIDKRLFDGLEKLKRFVDKSGRVYIEQGTLRTVAADSMDDGARYDVPGLACEGIYNIDMLMLLKDIATYADLTRYPQPCFFYGENLRGAIIGMRM